MSHVSYEHLLDRYRRYAPRYDRAFARYSRGTLGKALELLPATEGQLIDVACGTGLFAALVREHRPMLEVTGVDLSEDMLDRARERCAHDERATFVRGTAEHLPVDSGRFNVLTCTNAFHLVQDAGAALREFHRVLAPSGRIMIIDWCRDALPMKAMAVALRLSDHQSRQIRTLPSLAALVEEHGFEVAHASRFRVKPLWGMMAVVAEAT